MALKSKTSIEAHQLPQILLLLHFPHYFTLLPSSQSSLLSPPMAAASATPPFSLLFPSSTNQPHRLPRHRRPHAISLRPSSLSTPNFPTQLPFSLNLPPISRRRGFAAEASVRDSERGGSGSTSVSDDDGDGGFVGEDAAAFDLSDQKLTSWVYFTVILGVVLFMLDVVWIDNSAGGVGKAFVDAVSGLSDSHEDDIETGKSLRDQGEKLVGERASRVLFAGVSLPLAVSTVVVMLALIFIFALVHSGLASLRDQGEKLVGERAFRVLFAGVSLPLAVSTVVYFINHRYDGVQLWQLQSVPGLHQLVWLSSFISFFFLYPSTFNLLEVAAVDKPKMHLWETGIMRITRHPQMVGQVIWCLAHTLWIGNSVAVATSIGLIGHHLFGVWNGDRRLAKRYGADFEAVKRRTSVVPFAAIVDGRQKLPDDYYKEFLRLPYVSITALTIGAYLAHAIMQAASFRLHW